MRSMLASRSPSRHQSHSRQHTYPHPSTKHHQNQQLPQKCNRKKHIASDILIEKPEHLHQPNQASRRGCTLTGAVMSACPCNDPSCRPDCSPAGIAVEELVEQPDEPVREAHMPIVLLPANMPPPIVMSETGYPIGIAGPDGSPAWAKPKVSTKLPKKQHGHEHCCHGKVHRSHSHHRHAAGIRNGPEYLVPLGTPVPNPYGPGVIFLPPQDPRIIPCMPVQNPGHAIDYDDLDTIQVHNSCQPGNHVTSDPQIHGYCHLNEELTHEYARMKLRAEQSERARFEEIERNQALWNARQKQYEKQIWLAAMGKTTREEPETDTQRSAHYTATSDEERVININVRHPCKRCKQLVTIETQVVHQRVSTRDTSRGLGINIDNPVSNPNVETICEKCKVVEAEEERSSEFVRKLVQQVFCEADAIQKAKRDEEFNASMPSSQICEVISSRNIRAQDSNITLKYHRPILSHYDEKGSARFENMSNKAGPSKTDHYAYHPKHGLHGHRKASVSNIFRGNSGSETSSSEEIQVVNSNSGRKSHTNRRGVLATIDKEHVVDKENMRILSSVNSDDENEEEVIVIRRARRHRDKNHSNRSHPTLAKSATENPDESFEAIARRLVNELTLAPTRAETFHGSARLQNHVREQPQEAESGSGSDSDSSSVYFTPREKHHHSSTQISKRCTQTKVTGSLNQNRKSPRCQNRHSHYCKGRPATAEDLLDDYEHSKGRHDIENYDGDHRSEQAEPTGDAIPKFLSNWSLFRKTAL